MREKLPDKFTERMKKMLGSEYEAFLSSYDEPPKRGLRVNTLKISVEELRKILPYKLIPTGIADEGFVLLNADGIGNHPYHMCGLFYLQEPSAMRPAAELDVFDGIRVLDMCAAPGGKSGAVAAKIGDRGILVSNEIVLSRAKLLARNLERLGVCNSAVVSAHPSDIAKALPEYFDAVLVDAPCSGEGMFRKDEQAITEWSPEHVISCAARQLSILEDADRTLTCGGTLIYSTCTFSPEENEGTIERFLSGHSDYEIESMKRFYPHTSVGEGHFTAKLKKLGEASRRDIAPAKPRIDDKSQKLWSEFAESCFTKLPNGKLHMIADGRVFLLNEELLAASLQLHAINVGVMAGEIKKGRFEPAHSLFMAAHGGEYAKTLELSSDSMQLKSFLAGNTLEIDSDAQGYHAVTVDGYTIGFGKASGGVLKNHIPKALRV